MSPALCSQHFSGTRKDAGVFRTQLTEGIHLPPHYFENSTLLWMKIMFIITTRLNRHNIRSKMYEQEKMVFYFITQRTEFIH